MGRAKDRLDQLDRGTATTGRFHLFVGVTREQADAIKRDLVPGDFALVILRPRDPSDTTGDERTTDAVAELLHHELIEPSR